MPQKLCPICNQLITYMPGTIDFMHECETGDNVYDEEDVTDITQPKWNMQGAANEADPVARALGADIDAYTVRGHRSSTQRQRPRVVAVNLKDTTSSCEPNQL